MNRSAEARVVTVAESRQPARPAVREQVHSTAYAVAAGDDAGLTEAIDGFRWERRGILGRLVRHPRPSQVA
jgi:hypothetical protein